MLNTGPLFESGEDDKAESELSDTNYISIKL